MPLTPDDLRRRLAARVPRVLPLDDRRPAAVLIPLIWRPDGLWVVLNRRPDSVRHHRGQIAFPGGHCETGDASPLHTALREAEEEIGLAPDDVDVLGRLDDFHTISSRFHLTPVVGALRRVPAAWRPDPREVAEIIEVPLSALAAEGCHRLHTVATDGGPIVTPAFVWRGHVIWGATERMLSQLLSIAGDDPESSTEALR